MTALKVEDVYNKSSPADILGKNGIPIFRAHRVDPAIRDRHL
jgi:hypothetical protein